MSDDTAPDFVPLIDDPEALDVIVASFGRDVDRIGSVADILTVPMFPGALRASLDGH